MFLKKHYSLKETKKPHKTALLTSEKPLSLFLNKHNIFRLFINLISSDVKTKHLQDR